MFLKSGYLTPSENFKNWSAVLSHSLKFNKPVDTATHIPAAVICYMFEVDGVRTKVALDRTARFPIDSVHYLCL